MDTLINTALNPLVVVLRRSGLLAENLDYHFVRPSMVIMFFLLRLPEVVGVRGGKAR